MILLSILSFVGKFSAAIIIFNFTSFFLITAKKLDNFTFNTFTFSYPLFHARVNHFPNIRAIHAKIGVPK